jgi:hypothetical protein
MKMILVFKFYVSNQKITQQEKDRALRNLDMLLAIAEEHEPEFVEVCGFRVRK